MLYIVRTSVGVRSDGHSSGDLGDPLMVSTRSHWSRMTDNRWCVNSQSRMTGLESSVRFLVFRTDILMFEDSKFCVNLRYEKADLKSRNMIMCCIITVVEF